MSPCFSKPRVVFRFRLKLTPSFGHLCLPVYVPNGLALISWLWCTVFVNLFILPFRTTCWVISWELRRKCRNHVSGWFANTIVTFGSMLIRKKILDNLLFASMQMWGRDGRNEPRGYWECLNCSMRHHKRNDQWVRGKNISPSKTAWTDVKFACFYHAPTELRNPWHCPGHILTHKLTKT